MVVDKMIVAGIGFRKGVSAAEILAALDAALAAHGRGREQIGRLATSREKSGEAGLVETGRSLGVAVVGVEDATLQAQTTLTVSEHSLKATGIPSLSEAAALAAVGGKLLGPRLALGAVTCALAEVTQ
jgi:cobalt-precorrin 5A hydrolase